MILFGPHASKDDVARFRLEVETVAQVHHPNIVDIYYVGTHGGYSYSAFEYVAGGTRSAWQGRRPVNAEVAARIVSSLGWATRHGDRADWRVVCGSGSGSDRRDESQLTRGPVSPASQP